MALKRRWLAIGILGVVLGVGGVSVAAAQDRGERHGRVERDRGEARERSGAQAVDRGRAERGNRDGDHRRNDDRQARDYRGQNDHRGDRRDDHRAVERGREDQRRIERNWRGSDRDRSFERRDRFGYRGPGVVVVPRAIYPRRYGSGGRFSVFFGIGSGYRYGVPYYGRVYGPVHSGPRIYYGDVRLQVRPRDAAVYVDGYYAGIVDDFDGAFQRLTLEVGPHDIEIEAPGLPPQVYNVYVDPARTVDLHAELYPRY